MSTEDSLKGVSESVTSRIKSPLNMSVRELASGSFFTLLIILVYSLLLVPIAIIILSSFVSVPYPAIPTSFSELSGQWYVEMVNNSNIMGGLRASLIVAIFAAALGTLVAFITALGFARAEFPAKGLLGTMLLLPMLITPVITGAAFIHFVGRVGIPRGYSVLILAHSALVFPYAFLLIRSRLASFNEDLEAASLVMGANPIETKLNVTIPILAPTLIGSYLLAFTVSFGEFTASQFLIEPGTTTIPVVIFQMISTGLTPDLTAVATVLVVGMILISAIGRLIQELR